ncbi:hypothetical protein GCM10020000_02490 [Streptomyces olivoverticillatus]
MTIPHHATVTGTPPAPPTDPVVAALGALGSAVDCTGMRSLSLEGPLVLWLVVHGELDLFAVDAAQAGHWHFLGRLEAGTLLLGPAEGPEHTLVGRPLQGCLLRRIELRELQRAEYEWYDHGQYGAHDGALSPLEDAFALGIGRGLRVLYQAPLESRATTGRGTADDDVFWMQITPGSVQYGAAYEGYAAGTLLVDAAMWQGMVDQQYRLLYALDSWIEQLERAHEDRTAAGIEAGEAARTQADQALLASIDRSGKPSRRGRGRGASDDATYAVCRLVAEEARIALTEPGAAGTASDRTDPVERIALASRIRTRAVKLHGRWWRENCGPLVGHREEDRGPVALLWRRGGYEAVDPATGTRERIGKTNEAAFEPRAVMFYRPLPDRRLGLLPLLRFTLRGTGQELRGLVLGGLVAVGLGALVPIATGKVLGEYVPAAENSLIVQTALALIATSVVSAAFMLLQNISVLRMEGRIEAALQPAVWDRLLRLPAKFFAGRSTGELAERGHGHQLDPQRALRHQLGGTPGRHRRHDEPRAAARLQRPAGNGGGRHAARHRRGLPGPGTVAAALPAATGQAGQQAEQPGLPDPARAAQAARGRRRELRLRRLGTGVRPHPRAAAAHRPDQERRHGAQRGLPADLHPGDVHAAGSARPGAACPPTSSSPSARP